jgi:hypothetical protein
MQADARRSALVNSIEHAVARAEQEIRLAYQFNPGSYTNGALNAVYALRALVKRLRDEDTGTTTRNVPVTPDCANK